eukprot:GHVQ01012031.1.p1 GENE.GHVQ01012031.1~~GHVQ01012031.1.p1  ORF type:complete len:1750 (+),score=231.79 GHVQ01012031.1:911-6160(+)
MCPVFGLPVEGDDHATFNRRCKSVSPWMGCDESVGLILFMDGSCRRCSTGFYVKENLWTGDIWCEDAAGLREYYDLVNPFNCERDDAAARTALNFYRPCYAEYTQMALVPHYYRGEDLMQEKTMSACATMHGLSQYPTVVTQNGKTTVYNFPLIKTCDTLEPMGYLQCQTVPSKPYNYTTAGWVVWYSMYGICFSIILIFYAYKKVKENFVDKEAAAYTRNPKRKPKRARLSNNFASIVPESPKGTPKGLMTEGEEGNAKLPKRCYSGTQGDDDTLKYLPHEGKYVGRTAKDLGRDSMDLSQTERTSTLGRENSCCVETLDEESAAGGIISQDGYKNSFIGLLGFWSVVLMTVGLQLALLILVLDYYGLHYYTLCTDEDVLRRCDAVASATGTVYDWRSGLPCASGCLVSLELTHGSYSAWPYEAHKGGGSRLLVIFIAVWHVTMAWTVGIRVVANTIRSFFRVRCPLEEADVVLCTRPEEPEVCLLSDERSAVMRLVRWFEKLMERLVGEGVQTEVCQVSRDKSGGRYIDVLCLRCCWAEDEGRFTPMNIHVGDTQAELLEAATEGLSSAEALRRLQLVGDNAIPVTVPSLPMALFTEFFNYFYFYQFGCMWAWFMFNYWLIGSLVLSMTVGSGAVKVIVRRASQKKIQKMAKFRTGVCVNRDNQWVEVSSEQLVPGDVARIQPGAHVPCDMALVEGRCVVDESSLTGEPTPVPKIPVNRYNTPYKKTGESMKYSILGGTYVESVSPGPSHETLGIVVDTGPRTDKGELLRSILFPPKLTFQFDQHWKAVFAILLLWGIASAIQTMSMYNWVVEGWFYGAFKLSQIISPLIPAMFIWGESKAAQRLKSKQTFCVNLHRIVVAGKIKIFCFDKTGTITLEGLDFYGVQTIVDGCFDRFFSLGDTTPAWIVRLLGCCHELDVITTDAQSHTVEECDLGEETTGGARLEGRVLRNVVGNQVDKEMFAASQYTIWEAGAQPVMRHAASGSMIKVLRRFEFERSTMSMTVVVEDMETGKRSVYCKGSYERIAENTSPHHLPPDYQDMTRKLAKDGFYVLGIAVGPYLGPEAVAEATREFVESDLRPVGLLMFRNDLKPDSVEVMSELKEGDIRPVMITGDNALTANKIAEECRLSNGGTMYLAEACPLTPDEIEWRDTGTDEIVPHPMMFDDGGQMMQNLISGRAEIAVTGAAFDRLNRQTPFDLVVSHAHPHQPVSPAPLSPSNSLQRPADTTRRRSVYFAAQGTQVTQGSKGESEGTQAGKSLKNSSKQGEAGGGGKGGFDGGEATSAMQQILPYTRIFARMKPDQKVEAVRLHMRLGVTGMCGDGANDAAALRMSHCGIALAGKDSDASIVAPFSTSRTSLVTVVELIKEGRTVLANTMAGYKQLILYGQILSCLTIIQHALGVILSDVYWLTLDGVINVGMTWAIMQAKPAKKLAPYRPTASLLGFETVASVCLQVFIAWFFMFAVVAVLYRQPWFVCREFDSNLVDTGMWWLKGDNYEATVIGMTSVMQLLSSALIFSFGFNYRRSWFRNPWVVGFWLAGFALISSIILTTANSLCCLYRVNCGDWSLIQRWMSKGLLSYSSERPALIPPGCPCDEQILEDDLCEAEYTDCNEPKFSQTYHHNILPYEYRLFLFVSYVVYVCVAFFTEGFFVVGNVRSWLRTRKAQKRGNRRSSSSIYMGGFEDTSDIVLHREHTGTTGGVERMVDGAEGAAVYSGCGSDEGRAAAVSGPDQLVRRRSSVKSDLRGQH